MASNLLLLKEFLPTSALGLGWLSDQLSDPMMDAFTPTKTLTEEDVLRTVGQNFEGLASSASNNSSRSARASCTAPGC